MNLKNFHTLYHIKILLLIIISAFTGLIPCLSAEPGVTADTVTIGQSCALSGPSGDPGKRMSAGIACAFDRFNADGGWHGRRIRLIVKDDYYEPGQAIKNTEDLIFNNRVFALIGEVGTPTSRAVLPIAQKEKVPFIAPLTGARFFRTPVRKQVINIRAGYDEETLEIIRYLVEEKNIDRIACFYQDDSYGLAGLEGVKKALAPYKIQLTGTHTYQRNTLAVMGGFLRIRESRPQAVVLVGAYQPCAEFIKLGRAKGMPETIFAMLSFSATRSLLTALRNTTDNIILSQVVPSPYNEDLKIVGNYRAAMKKFQPEQELSYISLEGYIAGRFFIEVLKGIDTSLTRKKLIDYIEQKRLFAIDDLILTFGPEDHQGLDGTYLTRILDGKLVPMAP